MKLFCSDRNSLQPAGVRFIFLSASRFGLVYNQGKLGLLNYHKDLVLQWLKGSKQLFPVYVKCRFSQGGKILMESGKIAIFSRTRVGINNKHLTKFSDSN